MGEDTNMHHTLSRRSLLRRGAITGIAVIGASASAFPISRMAFAQNGDIELVTTSDDVRVRDAASLAGTVLGFVNTGDVVNQIGDPVDADGYTWLNISVQRDRSLSGWAASDFFERAGGTAGWKPGNDVHVNDDNVNLRSGPGLGNGVVGTYDFGTNAVIVSGPTNANGYAWFEIEISGGTVGWMASNFLTPGRSSSGTGWTAGTEVHVNDDNVNLRGAPGLGGTVIASFNANTNAGVIGGPQSADGFDWYDIGIGGTTGWMASDFLSEGHVGDDGTWGAGDNVMTTTNLNLRSGPGTGNSIIAVYGDNEVATVRSGPTTATGFDWYEVEVASDGKVGWFADEFLTGARFEPTGSRLRVVDGPLNLRASGDTSATIIATVPTNDVVVIRDASFAQNDGFTWANVYLERNPDFTGWIARDFTEEI
jgi:uncharacterized protein YgiM (DUF1202 family)